MTRSLHLRPLLVDGVFIVMRVGLILDALGWSVLLALPGGLRVALAGAFDE